MIILNWGFCALVARFIMDLNMCQHYNKISVINPVLCWLFSGVLCV